MAKVTAIFNGTVDQNDSMGFKRGLPYDISLTQIQKDGRFFLQLSYDSGSDEELVVCNYSLEGFFANWTDITELKGKYNGFNRDTKMVWGKYAGLRLKDIPAHYLLYIYSQNYTMPAGLKKYIIDNLEGLKHQASKDDHQ